MGLLTIEHSQRMYRADFALYGSAMVMLGAFLWRAAPTALGWSLAATVVLGLLLWSLTEYILHRFVLHAVQPFQRWHAQHHERPTALICAPTIASASLILTLIFLPTLGLAGPWIASALTLGVLSGYFAYATTHHAVHHWRPRGAWLLRRKRWHALHHRALHATHPDSRHHTDTPLAHFGVTSAWWDRVFGSLPRRGHSRRADPPPQTPTPRALNTLNWKAKHESI